MTNDIKVSGASVLMYPGVMDQVAEQVGEKYYLLPSSIHEFLVVPENGLIGNEELMEMVTSVNATVVSPAEILTDQVYHYDSVEKVFEIAAKYEARMAEKDLERSGAKKSLLEKLDKKKEQSLSMNSGKKEPGHRVNIEL